MGECGRWLEANELAEGLCWAPGGPMPAHPAVCARSGHGGAELQLRVRGLRIPKADRASSRAWGGWEQPGLTAWCPRVHRVSVSLQAEHVLEGSGSAGAAVGIPHGQGDGAGPRLGGAPAAGQEFAHGSLEVPHEEWVDDGVHGAVAVAQPGEHIEESSWDTVTNCLEGTWQGLAGLAASHLSPDPEGFPRHTIIPLSKETFKSLLKGFFLAVGSLGNCILGPRGPARPSSASN